MKSKKKVTPLEEAYKKIKVSELENIVENILTESTSLSLLLENPEELADLSEKIATFEQIAESAKTLTPNLSKFILDNCKNIFESVKQPELLENSLNGLAMASEILRSESPSNTFEWLIEAPNDVCEDVSKLSEQQLKVFRNHVPELQKILTNNQIKFQAKILNEATDAIDLNVISNSLNSIRQIIESLPPGFVKTKAGFKKYMLQFKKAAGLYGNDPRNQQKVAQLGAQAQKVINLLPSIAKIWPQISNIFHEEFLHLNGKQNSTFSAAAKDTAKKAATGIKTFATDAAGKIGDTVNDMLGEGKWNEANEIRKMKNQIKAAIAGQVQHSRGLLLLKKYPNVKYPDEINPDIVIEDIFSILLAPETPESSAANESFKIKNNFVILKEGLKTLGDAMKKLGSVAKQAETVESQINVSATGGGAAANNKEVTGTVSSDKSGVAQPESAPSQKPAQSAPRFQDLYSLALSLDQRNGPNILKNLIDQQLQLINLGDRKPQEVITMLDGLFNTISSRLGAAIENQKNAPKPEASSSVSSAAKRS